MSLPAAIEFTFYVVTQAITSEVNGISLRSLRQILRTELERRMRTTARRATILE